MMRYSYIQERTPPAPFIWVTVRCPEEARELAQVPAQVDTGADRTVIPLIVATQLELTPLRGIHVEGLGGISFSLPSFKVQIGIYQLQLVAIEVVASQEETFVLLGRDVLNNYRILLDGPQLALEVG